MRLVCPNCDAQYEVSDDAIPEQGRDVQCSSCGHAWFQVSPEVEAAQAAEEDLFAAPEVDAPAGIETAATAAAEATAAAATATVAAEIATSPVAAEPEPPRAAAPEPEPEPESEPHFESPAPLQRRSIDESLMAVLREEAEREAAARRTEVVQPLETQPDLGLQPAEPEVADSPVARRIAQMKGVAAEPAKPAMRRELLPDIEEINSTLRASSDRRQDGDGGFEPQTGRSIGRSGFRSGFVLMMILAVLATLAYVAAPKISAQIPGSAAALSAYVAAVDKGRLFLDGLMQQATGAITGDQKAGDEKAGG
ncbi:zinc-ribbon domain-containing protein [Rhodobacter ferrooxidans]|uniref:MJ0042 family finger-like protein n=1 Tax=Rhodobacter ferrooxidans TaxID=371731 RepID=C8S2D0_9RHOB|nr:zinc-ribbon domain-containing protein [Rhodobacter sp. SW2]EEW24801.1 MJ0042 family finger-like protein [Rhodobacter sp. SW2]